jgi:LmbE family N-acetylglucosaminyl deacetylase
MAHPDDEAFVSTWIRRLTRMGTDVSLGWSHDNVVRRAEACAAARALGVAHDQLYFLGGLDGRIAQQMAELTPRLARIVEDVAPDRIVTTAFEQGHIDHDATNRMVSAVFDGPVFEIPLYHPYTRRIQRLARFADGGGERLAVTSEEAQFKRKLLELYPSQSIARIFRWAERWERLTRGTSDLVAAERMRLQTWRDWRRPNLPSKLAAEVERCDRWRSWLDALDRFENCLEHL